MVLTRFFKPKWQHPDPEARLQAVAALTSEDADILNRMAREDEAPAVRRLALSRVDDLELMHGAAAEDNDSDIRQFARTCLSELLAGMRKKTPALDVRLSFLSRHPATELLEFVALNGMEAELRKSAQDRITRETVLHEIAIGDAVLANREAALERITDHSILEAINRQTCKRDKQIYRLSGLRLEAIREAQERPARIRAECEQICRVIEVMVPADNLQQQQHELQRLDARWQAIREDAEPACQARYAQAVAAFLDAAKAFQEAREAEQRQWAESVDSRQALLTQVARCKAQLLETQALSAEAATGYAAELDAWQLAWDEAGELPVSQAQPLDAQFTRDTHAIRQRLETLHDHRQMEKTLQSLLDEAERLLGSQQPVAEQAVNSLEKRGKGQPWPTDSDRLAAGLQRFEAVNKQLRKRLSHQQQQRQQGLERLPGMLVELETLLQNQTLMEAVPLHDRIQGSIKHLQRLGVSKEQLGPCIQQLHGLTPRVLELQSWRSWGDDEARQRLCGEMEALIGREMKPDELASEIRRLRSEWNQLRSSGGAGIKSLHKRFDKAASEAYKPCELYFKQQMEERNSNLALKLALLQRLESFLAAAEWSHMDWNAAVKFQRQLSNDWRRVGPVDRRKSREITRRYQEGTGVLNEQLSMERQRNVLQRKALIEQVHGLLDSEDINKAIDECKRLQTRWHVTVACRRQQENALWQEFREACDAVFSRRQQQQDARHETEKHNKAHRQQLCEQLEGLTASTLVDLDDAVCQRHRILGEWQASGQVAKHDRPGLDKRFEKAQHAFQVHTEALREQAAQAQLGQLQKKAGYCRELEQLLAQPDPAAVRSQVETLEKQWAELLPLQDNATEQAMQARYEKARCALLEGGEQREQLLSELRGNLESRKELCLRMEILAGVDSPAEAQQARLEFQVKRLAEAMGQGTEGPIGNRAGIQHEWYLTGAAPASDEQVLQARFEKASQSGRT